MDARNLRGTCGNTQFECVFGGWRNAGDDKGLAGGSLSTLNKENVR